MILFSLLKSHTIISSPLSLFSFHKRFTHKNIKPPKLHIPPHTPTNPNLLSHPKAYSHNPNKVAVPNNPKNEASFKLDSYRSSIPRHTKSIAILVKIIFIQISWPFSIRLTLFKWIILLRGPFLSDFMVKQSSRSYSVQIAAPLVK